MKKYTYGNDANLFSLFLTYLTYKGSVFM